MPFVVFFAGDRGSRGRVSNHGQRWGRPHGLGPMRLVYTLSQKVPPLACYNFDTHEWILIFFGTSVTDNVSNQKTLYYATLRDLCFCTTWQIVETRKSRFHSVGLCYAHNAPVRCLPKRKSCHLWCVW